MIRKLIMLTAVLLLIGAACRATAENKKETPAPTKESKIKVTFIELGSVRCIPCRKMIPIMKEIEEEYSGQVKVVFHDVWTDEGRPYARKHGIKLIPTQIFLDENGKEYFRHVGFFPKKELVKVLEQKGAKATKKKPEKKQKTGDKTNPPPKIKKLSKVFAGVQGAVSSKSAPCPPEAK
ncbi:MAG: thioredoxin family protein [Candidatus Aminicenantes bacterium]|nr:thioredoxin family protein [Candidatus Aminicenantes bacterium]